MPSLHPRPVNPVTQVPLAAAAILSALFLALLPLHPYPGSWLLKCAPILILASSALGGAILIESGLSFLGLGALPPAPEWGAMITEGAKNFYQWWIAVAPGLAMVTVVLGFNFLGDGLRDAADPYK